METKTQNVVVVQGDRAYFELTAETVSCLVQFKHSGTLVDVLVAMRMYSKERMIAYMREDEEYRQPVKNVPGASDLAMTDPEVIRKFVDDHLISMTMRGRVLTKEEITKLDSRHGLKSTAMVLAYRSFLPLEDDDVDIEDILSDTVTVAISSAHLCDDAGKLQTVDLNHHFRSPDATEHLAYSRSVKIRTMRSGTQRIPVNYDTRIKVYDSLIEHIDGVLLDGKPCTVDNKKDWIDRIPVLFKIATLQQLFSTASSKNE